MSQPTVKKIDALYNFRRFFLHVGYLKEGNNYEYYRGRRQS